MSSATQTAFVKDAWQTPRNARTLQAYMALEAHQIGLRLKELRRQRGNPPQVAVARAIDVGERTYEGWERGEARPSYRNLERLAGYYGVTENYLLTGEENAVQESPVVVSETVQDGFEEFRGYVQTILNEVKANRLEIETQNELLEQHRELLDAQTLLLAELREEQNVLNAAQRVLEALEAQTERRPELTAGPEDAEAPQTEDRRRGDRRHDGTRRTG